MRQLISWSKNLAVLHFKQTTLICFSSGLVIVNNVYFMGPDMILLTQSDNRTTSFLA